LARTSRRRTEADTNLNLNPVRAALVVRIALQRLLHPERRVASADRVVLVSERRTEQRHDPIAHHLIDGALVPVHCLHHSLEDRIEDLTRLLGVTVGKQLH
jgi:hypothetical protein